MFADARAIADLPRSHGGGRASTFDGPLCLTLPGVVARKCRRVPLLSLLDDPEGRVMTVDEDGLRGGASAEDAARDTSSQRVLFSYLTVDAADDYLAIMRLFTSSGEDRTMFGISQKHESAAV